MAKILLAIFLFIYFVVDNLFGHQPTYYLQRFSDRIGYEVMDFRKINPSPHRPDKDDEINQTINRVIDNRFS